MEFSNTFKKSWWAILLLVLTIFGLFRLATGIFNGFDIVLFIFWFILVLFPIISEISLFGINVKKDLEAVKDEIKHSIADIKNHVNFQPVINLNTAPAEATEYQEKIEEEAKDQKSETIETQTERTASAVGWKTIASMPISFSQGSKDQATEKEQTPKSKERLEKILRIENFFLDKFKTEYGESFCQKMKITNDLSGKSIIVDGLIYREGMISEIVEVRFITTGSFEHIFYVISNFLKRTLRLGIKIPVRFIFVSEEMNTEAVEYISEEIRKLNFTKKFNPAFGCILAEFYKYDKGNFEAIQSVSSQK
jgi:hypothetical protein